MTSYIKSLLVFVLFISFLGSMLSSHAAGVYGGGVPKTCDGSDGWVHYDGASSCWWSNDAVANGLNWVKESTQLTNHAANGLFTGYSELYVPYDGYWRLRTYVCHATSASRCDVSQAIAYYDSSRSLEISASEKIGNERRDFGSTSGAIPADSSLCYAFVDAIHLSKVYTTSASRSCTGLALLPDSPSVCHLNADENLNVTLGTLERSEIETEVVDSHTVDKTMSVTCQGNAAITTKMQFKYTPVSIDGQQLISASNGLGIAVFYNGQVIDPTKSYDVSFSGGDSSMEFHFKAVRDNNKPVTDIATGDFSADAIVSFTIQ